MRALVRGALAALLVAPVCAGCDSSAIDQTPSAARLTGVVPDVHVINATSAKHRIDIDYDRGFKTVSLEEGLRFEFDFSPPNRAMTDADSAYEIRVYESGGAEEKCFATLEAGRADTANACDITTTAGDLCAFKAGLFGTTCQMQLMISE